MIDGKRTFVATLVAPFASLFVLVGAFIESLMRGQGLMFLDGFVVIVLFSFGFVAISFAFLVIYGLPIHYLLSRFRTNNVFPYIILGVIGPVIFKYLEHIGTEMPASFKNADYIAYGAGGLFVSLVFWLIAVRPLYKSS